MYKNPHDRGIIDDILGLKTKWLVDEDAEEEEVERNVTERLFSLMRLDSGRWEVLRGSISLVADVSVTPRNSFYC